MQEPAAFKNTQVDSSDGLAKVLCVIGYIRSERPSDYYHSLEQNDLHQIHERNFCSTTMQ